MNVRMRGQSDLGVLALGLVVVGVIVGLFFAVPAYFRYQAVRNAENQITINAEIIRQTEQLVQVEQQKAQIRVVEANGIAEAQRIINATLTDKYLQHEAVKAQEKMAGSPSHTVVYIPAGQNGLPLVKTLEGAEGGGEK